MLCIVRSFIAVTELAAAKADPVAREAAGTVSRHAAVGGSALDLRGYTALTRGCSSVG